MTQSNSHTSSTFKKRALIIGNDDYEQQPNKLRYSVDNARKLYYLLNDIGFTVTPHFNTNQEMMDKITDFASTINDGDLVFFYFCGHGCQVDGKNYLIPVDDNRIACDDDVSFIGVSAESVLRRLVEKNKSNVTIYILDCGSTYIPKGVGRGHGKCID